MIAHHNPNAQCTLVGYMYVYASSCSVLSWLFAQAVCANHLVCGRVARRIPEGL